PLVPRRRLPRQHDVHQPGAPAARRDLAHPVPAPQRGHVLPRPRRELRAHEARVPRHRGVRGVGDPAAAQARPGRVTDDPERRAREVDNLRAVYQSLQPGARPSEPRSRVGRGVAAGAVGGGLLFVLGKAKLLGLLAGVFKFKTLATMLLSIGAYAIEWGWAFAAGFVLLIFVHEMGHAVALRREGIPAGAPVFIPFVGAFVAMQGQPRDAGVEARVAMAGPVPGYDALPPRQRATIALAYVALVVALLVTLPLHD